MAAFSDSNAFARALRLDALRMVHASQSSHIGSALSIADIIAVLYADVLNVFPDRPDHPDRDRFVLGKGHAVSVLYAALARRGFFPLDRLDAFGQTNGLPGHASRHVPGIEASTGSLGHGLSLAAGMALAGRRANASWHVFALLGDGECTEGSVWEALLFAGHHRLTNLTVIVDHNRLFSCGTEADVIALSPLADKARLMGWDAISVDGHDHAALRAALACPSDRARLIVAETIKGKGVPFMEDTLLWHFKSPSDAQYAEAVAAIEGAALA
jgi:transketolase